MILTEHPLSQQWLNQFQDDVSRSLAGTLLSTLTLISLTSFEKRIKQLLIELHSKVNERMALFPIQKTIEYIAIDDEGNREIKVVKNKDMDNEKRYQYKSFERIGHLLINLEREYPRYFAVAPTIDSMRSQKIPHIVLIDDVIGSGKSIYDYWHKNVSSSLKSWLSYGKCKLWIVTYAGYSQGIRALRRKIKFLNNRSFIMHIKPPSIPKFWDDNMLKLCEEYGQLTNKPDASLGFRKTISTVIFEHGCPNNAPSILWCNGRSWKALFPNRAIPEELQEIFQEPFNIYKHANQLWKSGQYGIALGLISSVKEKKGSSINEEHANLLTVLGFLLRGINIDNLATYMICGKADIKQLLLIAHKLRFIDDDNEVTKEGRRFVDTFRGDSSLIATKNRPESIKKGYYPMQFLRTPAKI